MRPLLPSALLAAAAFAAEPAVIPLWPGQPPGSEGWTQQEQQTIGPKDDIRRISNVTRPTLTVYVPPSGANGTAMIVCPGGGFRILAIDYEGHDVARWLNSLGVTAFVLKYRVMRSGDTGVAPAELARRRKEAMALGAADGQQAVRLVRSRAAEWRIAPDRIGMMGFSAGGYVTTSTVLAADAAARPNFAAPIYGLAPEDATPPAGAPPLFLVHADDDKGVPPLLNSVRLYSEWKKANLPAELHIYSKGGHGFGLGRKGLPVSTWPDRLRDWLDNQGLLKPARN